MPRSSVASPGRARLGVSLMFLTNGVLLSAMLPRFPEIKESFGLSNSEFGLLVIAFPAGALVAAGAAGRVIRRLGTLRTNAIGSVGLAVSIAVAATVAATGGPVWAFAAAMLVGGALDAIVDAAQNVQGVVAERWRGRSVMNSFHALWSVGAALGGLIGAAGAAADVALSTQMLVNGLVWAPVAVLACRLAVVPEEVRASLPPEHHHHEQPPGRGVRRHAWMLLLPLVVLSICGTLVEDVANNWAVLFLQVETDAPTGVAALGLTAALGAQFVGRLLGDPMTDRWGRGAVARTGGLLIAVGALMVLTSPAYPVAFAGFAVAGFGCATLVPAAFAAAGRVPGLPEGTGIAILGWLMRIGFLATSPAIGWLSDLTSLRTAMVIPVVAGLVGAVIAHRLGRGSTGPQDSSSRRSRSSRRQVTMPLRS